MDDQSLWWAFCIVFLIAFMWSRKINRDIRQMEGEIKKVLNKILFMRVEKHDELFLAYNAFNNEFMQQWNHPAEVEKQIVHLVHCTSDFIELLAQ